MLLAARSRVIPKGICFNEGMFLVQYRSLQVGEALGIRAPTPFIKGSFGVLLCQGFDTILKLGLRWL